MRVSLQASPPLMANVACEQALRGALAAGPKGKEEELATTSLEFEYLHRES